MEQSLTVNYKIRNLVTIVRVHGEVDLATTRAFRDALDSGSARSLIVDLTDCPYLGTSGLAVLIRACNKLEGALSVLAPEGSFHRKLLGIAGVDGMLPVFSSEDDASHWLLGSQYGAS